MRASERAYQTLRTDIIEWHLEPGTTVNEVEQAQRLGVSRTPIREAFSRLMSEGLVEPGPGRGVVVTPVSVTNVKAMFELRIALETQAAALAALKGRSETFGQLAARLDEAATFLDDDDADRSSYYLLVEEMDTEIDLSCATESPLALAPEPTWTTKSPPRTGRPSYVRLKRTWLSPFLEAVLSTTV